MFYFTFSLDFIQEKPLHFFTMTDTALSDKAAINAALAHNWEEAIRINVLLLKEDKANIDILNRLAFAYMQSGKFESARQTYGKVIKKDKYNPIATKNLKKLATIRQKDIVRSTEEVSPMVFLEDPGRTKVVECINAAPSQVLSGVSAGVEVKFQVRNHCIEIRTMSSIYLAALPDDLSFRLSKLIEAGNCYKIYIRSVGKNTLTIFIREVSRGKKLVNQPSFASTSMYLPFAGSAGDEGIQKDPSSQSDDDESSEE